MSSHLLELYRLVERQRQPLESPQTHLDEMHGPESLPYRTGSKIFQPTDSRQSGPEFGPSPRSSGGAPGWVEEAVTFRLGPESH
jgi:hypothetical protein